MARSFNLTAELNLRGPSNVRLVVADIRRQLQGVNVDVGVRIDPAAARNIANIQNNLTRFNTTLGQTQTNANSAAAAVQNLSRAVASLSTNLNAVPRNVQNLAGNVNNLTRNLGQANTAVQQTTSQFEEFGRQSALAVRRFAAFATVTGLIYKVSNAIGSATKEFVDFNKELIRVAQVTDEPVQNLGGLVDRITRLSTGLGVTSKELIQVSSTLAQAGLSAQDTAKALEALALSALAPSFDSLNDTVEGSIALMRQFGIGAGDLKDALGSVNAVAAKFAVEAGDLITAIQRTGGVFATASKGVSEGKDALNEFLAVFTSVRATTRESAETIATGLRTIFTRIQRSETIDALTRFGVVLTDLEGKFVGPYEAVRRLSEGLSKLDPRDLRFSDIVEELGGFRQIGKVIPLIQQFATAQAALKVAQEGQGSLAKDAATAQQSVANQLVKVREEFNALVRSIGQSESFQTFIKLSLDLASGLIKLADSAKTVLPALTAIAAIRGVSALAQFGVGFTRGLRRQNAGGPVRGFASGGYVPGVGNSDTVPAMLTPGEFVIRKKAVESIGLSSLQDMNRYAKGGGVVSSKRNFYGDIIPAFGGKQQARLRELVGKKRLAKGEADELNRLKAAKAQSVKTKEAQQQSQTETITGATLNSRFGVSFFESVPTSLNTSINEVLRRGNATGIDNLRKAIGNRQIKSGAPINSPSGVIGTISQGGKESFDQILSTGLPSLFTEYTKNFRSPLDVGNVPIQELMSNSAIQATKGYFFEAFIRRATQNLIPEDQQRGPDTIFDFQRAGNRSALARIFSNYVEPNEFKVSGTNENVANAISKVIAVNGPSALSFTTEKAQTAASLKTNPNVELVKKAAGGSISSEDTVPALLTPGEFVINKRAASRIGMARLNKLNNADRIGYNSGGAVGGIQRFAGGTNVEQAVSAFDPRQAARLTATIQKNVSTFEKLDALIRGWPVEEAGQAVKNLARAMEKGVNEADALAASINTGVGGKGADRTAKKGVLQQNAGVAENRNANPIGPTGFAASQARINAISQNIGTYQAGANIVATRNSSGAMMGGNVQTSQAGQQFAAQLNATKSPLQQLMQNFSKLASSVTTTQGAISALGQAGKMTGSGIMGLGKGAVNAARGIGNRLQSGGGMAGMLLASFGGVAIDQASKMAGGEKTEMGRQISSVGGNVLNYGATGAAIGSMFGPVGTAVGAATGAIYGFITGLEEAKKAGEEYAQSQRVDAASKAGESSGKVLQSYLSGPPTASGRAAVRSALIQTSQKEDVALLGARRQKGQSIQEFAAQQVKTQQAGAEQSQTFLAAEMMRTGKTFAEIKNVMNPADFARFAKDIAQADESFIAFQKGAQEDVEALAKRDPAAAAELQKRVNAAQQVMAERIAARQMAEQDAAVQAANTAKASAKLAIQLEKSVLSLEKTFGAMDQVLNKVGFDIGQAAKQREEIVSGRAGLTGGGRARDINILQNPNAYSTAEAQAARRRSASVIGGRSGDLAMRVSTFTDTARNAATRTVAANARAGQRDQTKTAQDVQNALLAQIEGTFGADTSIGRDLSASVRSMIQEKIKKAGEGEAINFDELINSALGPIQKASEQANNLLINATEKLSQAFDELGNVAQATADIQKRQKDRSIAFAEMRSGSLIAQREAMGEKIKPEERIRARLENINRRAGIGGAGAPLRIPGTSQAMVGRIQTLQGEQQALVKRRDELEKAGASAAPELLKLQTKLANVNNELEDTKKSFDSLPQDLEGMIGDLTSAISERVAELESRKEAGANFAERLVGSTPQELAEINRSYQLLNNTLNGNIITINRSQGAQQAYYEALKNGKSQQEAYADAQQQFATETKNAMSLFNDIMQMSGVKGAEFDKMRADLLVNFARGQGMGLENNPMFQKIIQELRKPPEQRAAQDPLVQELTKRAEVIRAEQDKAIKDIQAMDQAQIALLQATGAKIVQDINAAKLQVEVAVQNVAAQAGQQAAFANGGIVYASTGKLINFQPKGTDTVPAMLTPGEFVVNAKATKQNLPLLKSINQSKGGPVYLADGGQASDRIIGGNLLPNAIYSGLRNLQNQSDAIQNDTYDTRTKQLPDLNNRTDRGFSSNNKSLGGIEKNTNQTNKILNKITQGTQFSSGGVVYASSGKLIGAKSRGSDTVPAMLTPGEFVVNKNATKNNLGLLQNINSGYFADGGRIPRLNRSGLLGMSVRAQQARRPNQVADYRSDPAGYSREAKIIMQEIADQISSNPEILKFRMANAIQLNPNQINNDIPLQVIAEENPNDKATALIGKITQDPNPQDAAQNINNLITRRKYALEEGEYNSNTAEKIMLQEKVRFFRIVGINTVGPQWRNRQRNPRIPQPDRFDFGDPINWTTWLDNQKRASQEEIKWIAQVENNLNNIPIPGVDKSLLRPYAQRSGFSLADWPKADSFSSGGMVYAQDGMRIPNGMGTYKAGRGPYSTNTPSPITNFDNENFLDQGLQQRAIEAFGTSSLRAIAPLMAAAKAGTTVTAASLPAMGPFAVIPGFIAGSIAGILTGMAQNKLLETMAPDINNYVKELESEQPVATSVGALVPGIASGMITGGGLRSFGGGLTARAVSGGVNSIAGATINSTIGDGASLQELFTDFGIGAMQPGASVVKQRYNNSRVSFKEALNVARQTPLILTDDKGILLPFEQQKPTTRKLHANKIQKALDIFGDTQVLPNSTLGAFVGDMGMFMRQSALGTPKGKDIIRHELFHGLLDSDMPFQGNESIASIRGMGESSDIRRLIAEEWGAFSTGKYAAISELEKEPLSIAIGYGIKRILQEVAISRMNVSARKMDDKFRKIDRDRKTSAFLGQLSQQHQDLEVGFPQRLAESGFAQIQNISDNGVSLLSDLYLEIEQAATRRSLPENLQKRLEQMRAENKYGFNNSNPVINRSSGGIVYAAKGQLIPYQPKGTDTVPAMLTPGEFVVNRQATQNNLPLLQSINSGQYSRGGKVAYLAEGTPGTDAIQQNLKYLSDILMKGAENLNIALTEAVNKINGIQNPESRGRSFGVSNNSFNMDAFGSRLDQFIQQLQAALPPVIKVEGKHDVNVIINGATALQNALQGPIGDMVQKAIQQAFDIYNRKNELA